MANVRKNVTVQVAGVIRQGKKKREVKVDKNGPVNNVKVNEQLWRAALNQAGGDKRRLKIISETEVEILP